VTTWADTARPPAPDVFERIGRAVLRLFTSVDFAVVQIIALSLLALIGMTVKQLPTFAFRTAGDYENAMADLHARYDRPSGEASSTCSSGSSSSTSSRRPGSRSA